MRLSTDLLWSHHMPWLRWSLWGSATLALLVSRTGAASAEDARGVQVCLLAAGAVRPLSHVLPTGDVAVSADRRALATYQAMDVEVRFIEI